MLLKAQGKLEEAEPLLREALDGRRGPSGHAAKGLPRSSVQISVARKSCF